MGGMKTQQTLNVPTATGIDTIKFNAQSNTRAGNLVGWTVNINGSKKFVGVIERQDASDRAFVSWMKANR